MTICLQINDPLVEYTETTRREYNKSRLLKRDRELKQYNEVVDLAGSSGFQIQALDEKSAVPNPTMMLIDGANTFFYAQAHASVNNVNTETVNFEQDIITQSLRTANQTTDLGEGQNQLSAFMPPEQTASNLYLQPYQVDSNVGQYNLFSVMTPNTTSNAFHAFVSGGGGNSFLTQLTASSAAAQVSTGPTILINTVYPSQETEEPKENSDSSNKRPAAPDQQVPEKVSKVVAQDNAVELKSMSASLTLNSILESEQKNAGKVHQQVSVNLSIPSDKLV
ncbi:hypothetical protein Ciccas_005550 [Cichlidogyrus casuarinus]|uniref:Uncharacterized protein n=1 Tax=Cichlidogyrus casuarinus TaxID=1844966 RepID=A0ABD2Q8B1_9PLAT